MQCLEGSGEQVRKTGKHRLGRPTYICRAGGRQFIDQWEAEQGDSDEVKCQCLKLHSNGIGFCGIEHVSGVDQRIHSLKFGAACSTQIHSLIQQCLEQRLSFMLAYPHPWWPKRRNCGRFVWLYKDGDRPQSALCPSRLALD